jgi:hypothetical protein
VFLATLEKICDSGLSSEGIGIFCKAQIFLTGVIIPIDMGQRVINILKSGNLRA